MPRGVCLEGPLIIKGLLMDSNGFAAVGKCREKAVHALTTTVWSVDSKQKEVNWLRSCIDNVGKR